MVQSHVVIYIYYFVFVLFCFFGGGGGVGPHDFNKKIYDFFFNIYKKFI